jgi:predicted nucleic acid-binding protein
LIVIDTSALVSLLGSDDRQAATIRRRIEDEELAAPELIDLEFLHALRGLVRGRKQTLARAEASLAGLDAVPIRRYPHGAFVGRIWELRDNLTPYDAAFVALAEFLGATLLTGDARAAGAPGIRCSVEVVR